MKTIGVFFGSRTPEHDVSIITGELVISGLKQLGYQTIPIYIDKEGSWFTGEQFSSLNYFTRSHSGNTSQKGNRLTIDLEKSHGCLVFQEKGLMPKTTVIDLAFPAFHGTYGEDGTIQGLFEMLDVPYVGCGVAASAIAMDKTLTKLFYKAEQIPTTDFIYFNNQEWISDKKNLIKKISTEIRYPVMVKPARLGSSIGIARAKNTRELTFAIEVALHYDMKVIVEQYVENLMDITCCVIGNSKPFASLLQESLFSKDLFSYEDKYLNEGGAQFGKAKQSVIIPARLDKKTTDRIRSLALSIYAKIGCSGISRVDFLYNKKTKKIFANEINTIPGTLYHHLWKKSGVPLGELLKKLIAFAEERHTSRNKINYTFESDILRHTNSNKLSAKLSMQ